MTHDQRWGRTRMLAGDDGQVTATDAGVRNFDQDLVLSWLRNGSIHNGNCIRALVADSFHSHYRTFYEVSSAWGAVLAGRPQRRSPWTGRQAGGPAQESIGSLLKCKQISLDRQGAGF